MVAELTLFLSKDRQVQVRAHVTKSGKEVFCIKDFIRQTANKVMGPDDALIYWLSSQMKLLHEREILDSRMVQFLGPYESPEICISAAGLLILYHHLGVRFDFVNEKHREEVQQRLCDIVTAKSAAAYVEMHDDGEIDEQLAEMGDEKWTEPPSGSKFEYRDVVDGVEMSGEQMNSMMKSFNERLKVSEEEKMKMVNDLIVKLEAEKKANSAMKTQLSEFESSLEFKKRKKSGFSLTSMISEKGWNIENRETFCKNVVAQYKTSFPNNETFSRHGLIHFYAEDKQIVEVLLQQAYDQYLLETE